MKGLILLLAVLHPLRMWPEETTLTTLNAIHSLADAEAKRGVPVLFEATVTYYDNSGGTDLFVEDQGRAIYVYTKPGAGLVPGDRVLIKGRTGLDYRPDIVSSQVTLLHHGTPTKPISASFKQLIRGDLDCARVLVRGKVRSADLVTAQGEPSVYLTLQTDGGTIDALVIGHDQTVLKQLLDASVEVIGVVAAKVDSKQQLTGIVIEVQGISDVKILNPGHAAPLSLPITPMDKILQAYDVNDQSSRVRTRGIVTYYQPGTALVLQNRSQSLWVSTRYNGPLQIGTVLDVSGFPDVLNEHVILIRGELDAVETRAEIAPEYAEWTDLAAGKHAFDLVSTEGRVLARVRGATQDEYVLDSNGRLFSAILRHPVFEGASLPPMKSTPIGSRIRVTGICTLQYGSDPLGVPVAFDILMRSNNDIVLVAGPPILAIRNLLLFIGFLLLVMIVIFIRDSMRERKLRHLNSEMAYVESRRSRILEEINGSRPLADIIEQITEMVSFKLRGAPSWCNVKEGAQLGNRPRDLSVFRIASEEIKAQSGRPLGTFSAAFHPLAKPLPNESEILSNAAALARLAIETRGVYSELRHRSEFDLLTDVRNRFSLERLLDAQIEAGRENAGIFAFIYVDLDDFKQVNDVHGHQVGDRYLQAVAMRLKGQLRAGDLLARLGGDEFAVLLSNIRNRGEVEEVASRLRSSFDAPFPFDECELHGSASIGFALYPEDGTSKDVLVKKADEAMYLAKQSRRLAGGPKSGTSKTTS
ncbi:MAG TPA: GGDEF domain-containing protein [Terracidiphilus sp.]|nr:GGDEF domain-containing protein [Terracidiphilus sp.]